MISPEQFVREWIAALESGEFPQIQHALAQSTLPGTDSPMGFCCLGVACEVAYRHKLVTRETVVARDRQGLPVVEHRYDGNRALLPAPIRDLLNVGHAVTVEVPSKYRISGTHHDLTSLNDDRNFTFAQIAAIIAWNFLPREDTITADQKGSPDGRA